MKFNKFVSYFVYRLNLFDRLCEVTNQLSQANKKREYISSNSNLHINFFLSNFIILNKLWLTKNKLLVDKKRGIWRVNCQGCSWEWTNSSGNKFFLFLSQNHKKPRWFPYKSPYTDLWLMVSKGEIKHDIGQE